jgi:hypothetical protein
MSTVALLRPAFWYPVWVSMTLMPAAKKMFANISPSCRRTVIAALLCRCVM